MSIRRLVIALALVLAPGFATARAVSPRAHVFSGGACGQGQGYCVATFLGSDGLWLRDQNGNRSFYSDLSPGRIQAHNWTNPVTGEFLVGDYSGTSIIWSNGVTWLDGVQGGRLFQNGKCSLGIAFCILYESPDGQPNGILTEANEYSNVTISYVGGQEIMTAVRWNKQARIERHQGEVTAIRWPNGTVWIP